MNRNKIILSVLILSMITLVFSGCGGSGVVPTVPSTPESEDFLSDDFVLIQVKYPESNILFIAGKENENTMVILGEKNNQGDPTKITESVYVSEQGDELYFKKGVNGLPIYIVDCEGYTITFENYTSSTVDIALYDSNENLIEGPATIEIDPTDFLTIEDLLATKQSNNSYHSQPKSGPAVIPPWIYWHFTDYIQFDFIDDFTTSLLEHTIGKEKTVLIEKIGTGDFTITYPEAEVPSYYCFPPVDPSGGNSAWDTIALICELEEAEILEVLDNFGNAIVSQNWAKAKSYCVVGSEQYKAVDELEDLFDELSTLCNDINISCSGGGVAEVVISGKFAMVSSYNTCTGSCVPPEGEEISFIVSGEGATYLEKIGDNWKIYKEIAGDYTTEENF